MSDAALLALIIDDPSALRVLASWLSLHPGLSHAEDPDVLQQLARLANVYGSHIGPIVSRLLAARVLTDDGITELADKLLQTHVQQRLGGGKKKR